MKLISLPSPDEIHLWILEHGEGNFEILSEQERTRMEYYQQEKDQLRYLFTQSSKREILGEYLKRPPQEIIFKENEHGKPSAEGLEFSISHTEGISLLAVSAQSPIGIDVERIKPLQDLNELVHRISSKAEKTSFKTLGNEQQLEKFYHLWTAKEAYLKSLGIGFEIEPETVESNFPKLSSVQAEELPNLKLLEVAFDSHFVAYLATKKENQKITLISKY